MFIKLTQAYQHPDGRARRVYHINPNQIAWLHDYEAVEGCPAHTEVFVSGSPNPFMVSETPEEISALARKCHVDREYDAISEAIDRKTMEAGS